MLHSVEGSLTVKVDDFDTEPVHGLEPFRFIFAHLQLQGQVAGLDAVNFLAGPSARFQLEDGSGVVDMDVAVDLRARSLREPLLVPNRSIWASAWARPSITSTASLAFRRVDLQARRGARSPCILHGEPCGSARARAPRCICGASKPLLRRRPSTSCSRGT